MTAHLNRRSFIQRGLAASLTVPLLTAASWGRELVAAEYPQGFLLAEVPLGTGFLDLSRIVKLPANQRREIRLNLEMITRDPLRVPCLAPRYWTTFSELPVRHLASALDMVRRNAATESLPQITDQTTAEQIASEDDNVRCCLAWARERLS